MAKRGTVKRKSVEQEDFIAAHYNGRRSASSGAADTDSGDVVTETTLFECKVTGNPEEPVKKPLGAKLTADLEKVTEEAWQRGKTPALAIRWYDPDSILSDRSGWIDVVVRRVVDDSL
jgi:hypothetical protein